MSRNYIHHTGENGYIIYIGRANGQCPCLIFDNNLSSTGYLSGEEPQNFYFRGFDVREYSDLNQVKTDYRMAHVGGGVEYLDDFFPVSILSKETVAISKVPYPSSDYGLLVKYDWFSPDYLFNRGKAISVFYGNNWNKYFEVEHVSGAVSTKYHLNGDWHYTKLQSNLGESVIQIHNDDELPLHRNGPVYFGYGTNQSETSSDAYFNGVGLSSLTYYKAGGIRERYEIPGSSYARSCYEGCERPEHTEPTCTMHVINDCHLYEGCFDRNAPEISGKAVWLNYEDDTKYFEFKMVPVGATIEVTGYLATLFPYASGQTISYCQALSVSRNTQELCRIYGRRLDYCFVNENNFGINNFDLKRYFQIEEDTSPNPNGERFAYSFSPGTFFGNITPYHSGTYMRFPKMSSFVPSGEYISTNMEFGDTTIDFSTDVFNAFGRCGFSGEYDSCTDIHNNSLTTPCLYMKMSEAGANFSIDGWTLENGTGDLETITRIEKPVIGTMYLPYTYGSGQDSISTMTIGSIGIMLESQTTEISGRDVTTLTASMIGGGRGGIVDYFCSLTGVHDIETLAIDYHIASEFAAFTFPNGSVISDEVQYSGGPVNFTFDGDFSGYLFNPRGFVNNPTYSNLLYNEGNFSSVSGGLNGSGEFSPCNCNKPVPCQKLANGNFGVPPQKLEVTIDFEDTDYCFVSSGSYPFAQTCFASNNDFPPSNWGTRIRDTYVKNFYSELNGIYNTDIANGTILNVNCPHTGTFPIYGPQYRTNIDLSYRRETRYTLETCNSGSYSISTSSDYETFIAKFIEAGFTGEGVGYVEIGNLFNGETDDIPSSSYLCGATWHHQVSCDELNFSIPYSGDQCLDLNGTIDVRGIDY